MKITGEYWILPNGRLLEAGGEDGGGLHHEDHVVEAILNLIFKFLCEPWGGGEDAVMAREVLNDHIFPERYGWDEEDPYDRLLGEMTAAGYFNGSMEEARAAIKVTSGGTSSANDARLFAVSFWRWIRVAGNAAELPDLKPDTLMRAGRGLWKIATEEGGDDDGISATEVQVSTYGGRGGRHTVTISELFKGSVKGGRDAWHDTLTNQAHKQVGVLDQALASPFYKGRVESAVRTGTRLIESLLTEASLPTPFLNEAEWAFADACVNGAPVSLPEEQLDVATIVPNQEAARVDSAYDGTVGDLLVFERGGINYLWDGNHRLAIARQNGQRVIGAMVCHLPETPVRFETLCAGAGVSVKAMAEWLHPLDAASLIEDVDSDAHEAATSPHNDLPEPTDAAKKSGRYRKGRTNISGLTIAIENPEGSKRSGASKAGKRWSVTMKAHYGFFPRIPGYDGDEVDCFVKPGTPEDWCGMVFVINQVDPSTRKMDEHKCMVGYKTSKEARSAYMSHYERGWRGLESIRPMFWSSFRKELKSGKFKKGKV